MVFDVCVWIWDTLTVFIPCMKYCSCTSTLSWLLCTYNHVSVFCHWSVFFCQPIVKRQSSSVCADTLQLSGSSKAQIKPADIIIIHFKYIHFFIPQFCNPFFLPSVNYLMESWALRFLCQRSRLTPSFLLCMRSPSCFFSPDREEFPQRVEGTRYSDQFLSPPSGVPAGQGEVV